MQMGWIESPPYFCTASEAARDVAVQYIETPVGTLPDHKFQSLTDPRYAARDEGKEEITTLMDPRHVGKDKGRGESTTPLKYLLKVYVDDYMSLVISKSIKAIRHVATAVMMGIHDVFPADAIDTEDSISKKKLMQGLSSTGREKRYGWRRRSGHFY